MCCPLPASSYMLMEAGFGVSTHIELTDHLGYEKHDRAAGDDPVEVFRVTLRAHQAPASTS